MNKTTVLKGNVITQAGIQEGLVHFVNGRITAITEISVQVNKIIDLGQAFIAPGFIDLHFHGIHHYHINKGLNDLFKICQVLPQYGVTGFLPTLTPLPQGEDITLLSELATIKSEGATVLGFHLEGPFLKLMGSMLPEAAAKADPDRVTALIKAAKPYRTIFSISPDVENITAIIPLMTAGNNPVFMTHTAADVKQTQAAIELGALHATHFYDVFPCPEVSEPGVRPCGIVEAVLADARVSVDFILDGVHVDPIAVKMAMACKAQGPGCVCLITDSNIGAGLGPGRFVFRDNSEVEFAYEGSPARQVADNTLAGSGLTMDQAVRNAMKFLNVDLSEAIKMASSNPAKVMGVADYKGKIEVGYDADLVILDEQFQVRQTWVRGELKYAKQNHFLTREAKS